ncbi:heterokaryon incompatibility protein-domain-containing protein [Phaeosphaeriaceae sp. PMI808]|nr:heterokaryon incompatibility protein-domain-containing protein [Phaeosphaeriaceae sp. PMI808]
MATSQTVGVPHTEQDTYSYPDPRPQWTTTTPYQKLQVGQVRLLRIESLLDQSQAPIRCTLKTFDLSTAPSFHALSYTWGIPHLNIRTIRIDPASTTRGLECNENKAQVGENLYDFLVHCAHSSSKDLQGYLWIDALCINQGSISERSEQVKLMSKIYQKASGVFVWLGPEDHSTKAAISLMDKLLQLESKHLYILHPSEVRDGHPNFLLNLRNWQALAQFFEREWFRRCWIMQEVVFAETVIILCGSLSISWDSLSRFSHFLATSNWTMLLKNLAGLDQPGGSISLGYDTPTRFAAARRTWLTKDGNKFLYALIRARPSNSEDPRDKVYSLLGLGEADIFPDYQTSTAAAYTTAARYILENSRSLYLLACVEGKDFQKVPDLPSWVPDWTCSQDIGLRVTGYPQFEAASKLLKSPILSTDHDGTHVLGIEATKLDEIVDACETKKGLRSNLHNSNLWEMISKLDAIYAASGHSREEALWRTLHTNRGTVGSSSNSSTVGYPASPKIGLSFRNWVLWRYATAPEAPRKFPSPSLARDLVPTECEISESREKARVDASYLSDLAREASLYDLHYSHAIFLRPFCTSQGYFGIGTQCLRKGDSVWIAPGCPCPLILRRIEGRERHRLVGGSYVHGFMNGEILRRENLKFDMVSLE